MDELTADELIVVEVLALLADAGSGFCPKKHQETSYSAVENHAAQGDTTVSDKNQQPDSPVSPLLQAATTPPAYNSCTVCGKSFQSHQALGGHMTMHRVKIHADGGRRSPAAASGRVHECAVCHDRFPTGQALGGHKRKHFQGSPIIREAANPFKRVALESAHGCRSHTLASQIRR